MAKKKGGGRSGNSLRTHNEGYVPSVAFDESNNVPIITNHPLPSSVQD